MKPFLIVLAPVVFGIVLLSLMFGTVDWGSSIVVLVIMALLFAVTMWYKPRK